MANQQTGYVYDIQFYAIDSKTGKLVENGTSSGHTNNFTGLKNAAMKGKGSKVLAVVSTNGLKIPFSIDNTKYALFLEAGFKWFVGENDAIRLSMDGQELDKELVSKAMEDPEQEAGFDTLHLQDIVENYDETMQIINAVIMYKKGQKAIQDFRHMNEKHTVRG